MKLLSLTISALIGAAFGAPAIVWNNGKQKSAVHSSEELKVSALISGLATNLDENSLDAAVFVVAKSSEGAETLSKLTSSGALPRVASKYDEASVVHSHIAGIKTAGDVARECGKATEKNVIQVTLDEFHSKMTSLGNNQDSIEMSGNKKSIHRAKALGKANIMVINIPASFDPSKVDQAVFDAIEHKLVGSVVLAGQRSNSEVRLEQKAEMSMRFEKKRQQKAEKRSRGRRRLEENNGDDNANDDGNNSNTLEFYVPMTPNIFAGIIFTLFFAVVTWTGLMQMNMIQGQDVYVSKMPCIGREA